MSEPRKIAFYLPNLFTALNMACGFAAIIFAFKGNFYSSCIAILLGVVFDSVDGRVARLTGTTSAFGEQFDSLSDLVSFGLAPAIIFYLRFLSSFGRLGLVLSFLFLLSGALRLARFNANVHKVNPNFFQGLPIPSGAVALVGLVLLSLSFPFSELITRFTSLYILFYAVLMISTIPFPSFKNSIWVKQHKKQVLFLMFLILATSFIYEEIMILVWLSLYVISSMLFAFFNREKISIIEWHDETEE
ncbi:MAG: CDP-diacylglycerol--serine O-phosphatidyltransferase [Bacteriovoracaceae bacterium]|nr:CDP-diacylglycerol--serine O-phosphatidyltransferase [Bacteriovoracaceae bacterium]